MDLSRSSAKSTDSAVKVRDAEPSPLHFPFQLVLHWLAVLGERGQHRRGRRGDAQLPSDGAFVLGEEGAEQETLAVPRGSGERQTERRTVVRFSVLPTPRLARSIMKRD